MTKLRKKIVLRSTLFSSPFLVTGVSIGLYILDGNGRTYDLIPMFVSLSLGAILYKGIDWLYGAGELLTADKARYLTEKAIVKKKRQSKKPPKIGEFALMVLLPREGREDIVGDTNEIYSRLVVKLNPFLAKCWYGCEIIKTAWPLAKRAFKLAVGWGAVEKIWSLINR
jgi:hypothetical protein